MNPKLLKERIKTKAQRPDIVVAYHNFLRHETDETKKYAEEVDEKREAARRTA